jgi:predicted site-specific integrase-resolvase
MKRFISKEQVRWLFGALKGTVDRWIETGKLPPPRKRFGFLRWDYEQVITFLKFKRRI